MKVPVFLALLMAATVASGQTFRVNVERPARAHELIETVPEEIGLGADRATVAEFIEDKWEARESFTKGARGACPMLLNGTWSVAEFAAHLDLEVQWMNITIAAAYDRMTIRLSSPGESEIQSALRRSARTWPDTRAVDIAAVAPYAAEAKFKEFCQ